ncbi:MAG: cytochrome c3 family protein [Chloroflexi bacterium]|nr:cytochrome c3 family protein [Chloroflexota bacterium]
MIEFINKVRRTTPLWVKIAVPMIGLPVTALMLFILVFVMTAWLGRPLPVFGFADGPEQPIPFPHTVHAGTDFLLDAQGNRRQDAQGQDLHGVGLDCTFCHRTVTDTVPAGIPPQQQCAFCHQVIGSVDKQTLAQLRNARLSGLENAINWQRVHRLPDSVRFIHEPHIRFLTSHPAVIENNPDPAINRAASVPAAQVCSTCHGDVKTMTRVKQVEALKMGQCVNCHRNNGAPTDCITCHF